MMKNAYEYIMRMDYIKQDEQDTLPDYSNWKTQEALSAKINAVLRDCVKEAEDAPYKYTFEIVSHSVTPLNKAILLSFLICRKVG
jgi:hypothetical protein